jgi:hypothetical protein
MDRISIVSQPPPASLSGRSASLTASERHGHQVPAPCRQVAKFRRGKNCQTRSPVGQADGDPKKKFVSVRLAVQSAARQASWRGSDFLRQIHYNFGWPLSCPSESLFLWKLATEIEGTK